MSLLGHRFVSEAIFALQPVDRKILHQDGASISAGTGASLPMQMRIRHHLQKNGVDLQTLMQGKSFVLMPDYFFPTRFTALDSQSKEELEANFRQAVFNQLSRHQYVLVGLLPESNWYTDSTWAGLSSDHPVKFVTNFLESSETRKENVRYLNSLIQRLPDENSAFIVLDPKPFLDSLIARGDQAISFVPDRVHPNDKGQILFYNDVILPGLNKIPALYQRIPRMPDRGAYSDGVKTLSQLPYVGFLASDFVEEAISSQVLSSNDFENLKEGLYWANYQTGYVAELKDESALITTGTLDNYSESIAELEGIHGVVSSLAGLIPKGFTVAVNKHSDGVSLSLNLAQALFYTSIELKEVAKGAGIYEAYGYDFWASSNDSKVNYYFRVTLDPTNPTEFDLHWEVLPLLRDDTGILIQPDPLLRLGYIDAEFQRQLELLRSKLPRLEYDLRLKVK